LIVDGKEKIKISINYQLSTINHLSRGFVPDHSCGAVPDFHRSSLIFLKQFGYLVFTIAIFAIFAIFAILSDLAIKSKDFLRP
jgi:hypothetical protein